MVKYTKNAILKKIQNYKLNSKKLRILILGLTYKKNVADLRNSLSIKVYQSLKKTFKKLSCYDPMIDQTFKKKYSLINKSDIKKFDIYIILTKHDSFKIDLKSIKRKAIIDIFS